MPYQQEVSRRFPAFWLFLLDQSGSMQEMMEGSSTCKMEYAAGMVNGWLQNLAIRCTGAEGIREYYDLAVLGYATDGLQDATIESLLPGTAAGSPVASIRQVGENPLRLEQQMQQFYDDDTGELMETPVEVPIWLDAKARGDSPACSALYPVYEIVEQWIREHPRSFPPIVIHITSGEITRDDPLPHAEALRALDTEDGNVLLFHCYLTSSAGDPIVFPHDDTMLPDEVARTLFLASSILPNSFFSAALAEGFSLEPGARGMAVNADLTSLLKFLDIGTRVAPRDELLDAARSPESLGQDSWQRREPTPEDRPLSDECVGLKQDARPPGGSRYRQLLAEMPSIAVAVNPFRSDAVQLEAFRALVSALEAEPDLGVADPPTCALAASATASGAASVATNDPFVATRASKVPSTWVTRSHAGADADHVWVEADQASVGRIDPDAPALVLFVLDRSVDDPFSGDMRNACARLQMRLGELVEQIVKFGGGSIDVGVVSYGVDGMGEVEVRTMLEGGLSMRSFARDHELEAGAVRIDEVTEEIPNGVGGLISISHRRPILVEAEPTYAAAAAPAFSEVARLVSAWCADHPAAGGPPVVIHLTRGRCEARDIGEAVGHLASTRTSLGTPVVLYHVVESETDQTTRVCPDSEFAIDDFDVQCLWRLSSPLLGRQELSQEKPSITYESRGLVVNGPSRMLLEALRRARR